MITISYTVDDLDKENNWAALDKTNKMICVPSLIGVFALCLVGAKGPSFLHGG